MLNMRDKRPPFPEERKIQDHQQTSRVTPRKFVSLRRNMNIKAYDLYTTFVYINIYLDMHVLPFNFKEDPIHYSENKYILLNCY